MFASSCQNELELGAAGEESMVSFTIATPDMGSRAYSDGATATALQYAVYNAAGEELTDLTVTDDDNVEIHGSTTVKLKLTTGNTYSVIFWAAAPNAPYTVDFGAKTMTVNYNGAVSNDEARDAFYKYETFTVNGAEAKTIELKRPFAQLNIGTADYAASTSAGYTPKYSYVKVPVSSVLYFENGDVNEATTQEFGLAEIPTEKLVVNGTEYTYLAMNYLLVDDEKDVVDVEFGYGESDNVSTAKTRTVGSVPVQRNYRTNIFGNILTSDVEINVTIEPEYDNSYSMEAWDGVSVSKPTFDSETNTYYISQASELAWVAQLANGTLPTESRTNAELYNFDGATIKLENDINLNGHEWTPISLSTDLANGKTFRGTFDGQGHTIYNMTSNRNDVVGLFGYVYAATIKNVTISNANLNSKHFAGGIVAWVNNYKGNIQKPFVIDNCKVVNSTITSTPEEVNGGWDNGDKVGGLVGAAWFNQGSGLNDGTKIANSSVLKTTIKAYRDFGGLVGYAQGVNIENCTANVTLEQDLSHDYKNPTPTTFSTIFGNNAGLNSVNGQTYLADGVTIDDQENYHIFNAAGLKWVADSVNTMEHYVNQSANKFDGKTVYLSNDIDLGGEEWRPIGDYAFSRTSFNGVFDGKNYTISNFKVTKPVAWTEKVTEASYGFFGNVKGTIKNLTIENATIKPEGGRYTAALVGRLHNGGSVENCHVVESSVTINHWQVGGLVGQNNNGNISGCSVVRSTITGYAAVGAIIGMDMTNGEHKIENCRVSETKLVQNDTFGESYDASYGLAVGLVNASGIILHLNEIVVENNTIKDQASNKLVGDVKDGAKIIVNGTTAVFNAEGLKVALTAGGNYALVSDIYLSEPIQISGKTFSLNGNGYKIGQSSEYPIEGTATTALLHPINCTATIKNLLFDGLKVDGPIRSVDTKLTLDNITVKNCERRVSGTTAQGLFRLHGESTVTNCIFEGNLCPMCVSFNWDGNNNLPQVVENCLFENNECISTAVVYYVKGSGATINNNKFVRNSVTVDGGNNAATLYMGFTENNVITNNLFENNTVKVGTSKRVAGGVMIGYEAVITGNAFVGNTVNGVNAKGNDVCASVYYTDINLSGNYWGGGAPIVNEDYFVEYSDKHSVIINDYLTTNPIK